MKFRTTALPLAVLASGAMVAASAPAAVGASHARSTTISTPQLVVTMSGKTHMKVVGPRTFSAGRVSLKLVALKGEQEFDIARLHKGYTLRELRKDFATYGQAQNDPTPASLKALRRVVNHTSFYGGFDSGTGHATVSGSVVLSKAGTYLLMNDDQGPGQGTPVKLHVGAKKGSRIVPDTTATVTATNAKRFGGSKTLPASGSITFKNKASNSPHFLFLQHVKKGTTRKQVIKGFFGSGRPTFVREGTVGVDALSPHKSLTLSYSLPAGDYAEMCFFPDLQTGMPHAAMGMVRIVHLK